MNGRINYQRMLEDTIAAHRKAGEVPTLLLHSCCGPCSSYVLFYLSAYFGITVLYYNPNIYPPEEYQIRAKEQVRFIEEFNEKAVHPIRFAEGDYEPERFYAIAKGFEAEPERGARCHRCYRLRLEEAARYAAEHHYDYITTTLSISPQKDAAVLNAIGGEAAEQYGVKYLFSDFKKKDGFLQSTKLAAEYGMYRQDYCGCEFSLAARQAAKQKAGAI